MRHWRNRKEARWLERREGCRDGGLVGRVRAHTVLQATGNLFLLMGALRSPELTRDRWNSHVLKSPLPAAHGGPAPPTHSVVAGINSSPREGPRL